MPLLPRLQIIALNPGLLFPMANLFAFLQSRNPAAIGIAAFNVLVSIYILGWLAAGNRLLAAAPPPRPTGWRGFVADQLYSPLRITAWCVLTASTASFIGGAWLPALAGLAFGAGNVLASSLPVSRRLQDTQTPPWRKAVLHPAIYYGIGYAMTGLMAGGGLALLGDPLANMPALIATVIGVATILLSSLGLLAGLLRNDTPFWIVAAGSAINALAGSLSGNALGCVNCLFSMSGEARLGWLARQSKPEPQLPA